MKIIINLVENDYNYKQDGVNTLGDLVLTLVNALNTQGYVRFSFLVDNRALESIEGWPDISLETVQCLTVTATMALELDVCIANLEQVLSGVDKATTPLKKLEEQWDLLVASLNFWLIDFSIAKNDLNRIENYDNLFNQEKEQTRLILTEQLAMLRQKDKELLNPLLGLAEAVGALQGVQKDLSLLSVWLMQGADQQAMASMLTFSKALRQFDRCTTFLDEEKVALYKECNAFYNDLTVQLNAFTNAYETKDYVLAGDIAEYELAERLNSLDSIKEKLGEVM